MSTEPPCAPRFFAGPAALLVFLVAQIVASCGAGSESGAPNATDSAGKGFVIQNPSGDRPYFFDFETVADGETVTHVFELKNTDPVPITVQDVIPSCSCTNPRLTYKDASGTLVKGKMRERPVISIPPGAVANLEISINSNHVHIKNLDKLASVHLRCDSENRPFMAFELHLVVERAFQATPQAISMPNTPVSTGARAHTDIVPAIIGETNKILAVESVTEGMTARLEEVYMQAGMVWRVHVELHPPLELGVFTGKVSMKCSGIGGKEEAEPFLIDVRADVVPDVVIFPPSFVFNQASKDAPFVAECTLTALAPGHRVRIVDSLLQGDYPEDLTLAIEPKAPDADGKSGRWKLVLSWPAESKPPSFAGRVQLTMQDPNLDVLSAPFAYRSDSN